MLGSSVANKPEKEDPMKLIKFFVPALLMMILVMLPALALAESDEDFPPDDCPPPPPPHHEGMMDDMMAQVDLIDAQEQLLETMKEAMHAHMKAVHEQADDPSPEEFHAMHDKMMNMHRLFGDELKKDSPDFTAVGTKVKKAYDGTQTASFNKMVEAMVAFHASLTAEQREILVDNMPQPPQKPHER